MGVVAIGDFAHVVAGSVEAFILLLQGMISIEQAGSFLLAASAENIIGGTFMFAVLAYKQVKGER